MNAYNPITEAPKSKTDQAKQQEHQPEIRQNLAKHQIRRPEKNLFLIQFASKLKILWRKPLAGAQFSTAGCWIWCAWSSDQQVHELAR